MSCTLGAYVHRALCCVVLALHSCGSTAPIFNARGHEDRDVSDGAVIMARTARRSATIGVASVVSVLLGVAVMRGGPVSSSPGTLMLGAPTTTQFAAQLQDSGEMPAARQLRRRICTARGVPTRPPRCAPHRRSELTRDPPRVAASLQRGYLADSSNSAGLIASEGAPSGRLWARVQDGAAESGALTALAARAEAAAQEVAAQTRGGSAGATHYMSVEAGALASIAAQAHAQIRLSKERSLARDAQRQAALSARRPASSADTVVRLEDNSPQASPASWAVRDSLDETAREPSLVRARRKLQQRQQQLERMARLDNLLTARRRVQRKVPCLSL